jgi:hypothetical protein
MLGMFHLLPLLKGWEYKKHVLQGDVRRGGSVELSISETGWLLNIIEITNDCYGTVDVEWEGADLQISSYTADPESVAQVGAFQQDPSGWIQLYRRPNPYSTAGLFAVGLFTGGFEGSTLPYVPTVKLRVRLPVESTQEVAFIRLLALTIAVTDMKAFIRSLRRVLDAKSSLEIDPALFVVGPAQFKEE